MEGGLCSVGLNVVSAGPRLFFFFTFSTQKTSQVQHWNFFLLTSLISNNVNTQNRLSSENGMKQMQDLYRECFWFESRRRGLDHTRQKGTFFKWNKDKKQQQTEEVGRHGWNHKMRGKKIQTLQYHVNKVKVWSIRDPQPFITIRTSSVERESQLSGRFNTFHLDIPP